MAARVPAQSSRVTPHSLTSISVPAHLSCLPLQGWICNSSICMKRRGLRPTGIAIYDAHERGYKSVAHLLQVSPLI